MDGEGVSAKNANLQCRSHPRDGMVIDPAGRVLAACATPPQRTGAGVAVGETVILLHPPSTFSRRFNSDGERASAK